MSFLSFKPVAPSDYGEYKPKEFTEEELDALHIQHGMRNSCKNYLAEHRQ
eukprot:CAMPEP_0168333050 /NCGR_PEP_ID=MMETSP0213-20121227/9353_1 /TAXON_ID=151035 /ORGANISM="Euplotes harpa, Strain FSP1.4" /LENGTH=49 /DNA_ID=CAMNT_0008337253 /DNA_START=8 /DNA_END=157 /DNA_ORIENTATION=-